MTDEPAIRLRDVHKSFGPERVLCGVDLDVQAARTTVVIGPSGCGKSVLLKLMIGLLRADRGRIWVQGREVTALSERDLVAVRRNVGFLFQGGALFDSMTVAQNIVFPMEQHEEGSESERRDRCREVLGLVGLDGLQDRYPEELSGGQKKRVALARAIALRPAIILYDEPTTGLDPVRADLINELILRLQARLGTTAVVVTHDLVSARKVGDRIVMLHDGRLIADTTPDKLNEVDDETVARFVQGQAGPDELGSLRAAGLAGAPESGI
jgi:phospholipid/cholesterol/gamma-HCH transport system ATP-binding protein